MCYTATIPWILKPLNELYIYAKENIVYDISPANNTANALAGTILFQYFDSFYVCHHTLQSNY